MRYNIDVSNLKIESFDEVPNAQSCKAKKISPLARLIFSMKSGQTVELPCEGDARKKNNIITNIRQQYKRSYPDNKLIARNTEKGIRIYILAKGENE